VWNDTLAPETVVPEGYQFPPGRDNANVLAASIDEHYFDAMGLTLLQGRNVSKDDSPSTPRVAIVNQQFADHYWPNQDPIGKRFRDVDTNNEWVRVVGVAKTTKYVFIAEPPTEFVYLPYRQKRPQRIVMLAESHGDPATLAAPLR